MRTLKFCGADVDIGLIRHYPILQLNLKNVEKEDVARFWNAVSTVIEDHLKANKGVILPGIGSFTYVTKQRQIGEDTVQCTREPIFIISDKLATANWLHRPQIYFDELVPSKYLNFFLLSNFLDADNCKLRQCYNTIVNKIEHYVMIRRSFVLPFPEVGKLIFQGTNYWFKFNKTFLATQRHIYATNTDKHRSAPLTDECKNDLEIMGYPCDVAAFRSVENKIDNSRNKKPYVRRSIETANQIKRENFERCVDNEIFIPERTPESPQTLRNRRGLIRPKSFILSYPKPCMEKHVVDHGFRAPKINDPGAIFHDDYSPRKKKKKCIHHEDLDTCPVLLPMPGDTIVDRLEAGRDPNDYMMQDDAAAFGPNARKAFDDATWDFRKTRMVKTYSDDDMKEAIIKRHADEEYARDIKERKEMLHALGMEAHEYNLVNRDLVAERWRHQQTENDFNNQFVFPERPATPPWKIAKRENDSFVDMQRECTANKINWLSQKENEEAVQIHNAMKQSFESDVAEEKRIAKHKIAKQRELLNAMEPRQNFMDGITGEYFELPQEKLNKHRQWCYERRRREARENLDDSFQKKRNAEEEWAVARNIEANMTKEIRAMGEARMERKLREKEMLRKQIPKLNLKSKAIETDSDN